MASSTEPQARSGAPPPYSGPLRTVYDETHRGVWHPELSIDSLGNAANLLGYLENHSPTTDGSFSICFAGGSGVFISQALYNSIPLEHRPALDTSDAGKSVNLTIIGGTMTTVGSILFPFILTTDESEQVRLVLKVYVVPNLLMGMFWGQGQTGFKWSYQYGGFQNPNGHGPRFNFDFGRGDFHFYGI
ncbi:hypothetical protein Hypma_009203 [Hypsizygus marmoreus]|uniref:Uncharacterized protein n=1 Tax=Hypsizygus marmoreus TaxID=39966 RepID=A0A369JPV3_HYPMA|nr:hypothetical protein Hypma_009203 [Hypsizygus marmoreus]